MDIAGLPPMMLGSILFPSGFFLAGWTSNPSIHWFPSVLGFTLIGVSFLLIFQVSSMVPFQSRGERLISHSDLSPWQSGLNYLIDSYTKLAASTVASNTFLRSIFAVISIRVFFAGISWTRS
jgi:DHA1 family multidrug resistance protein-like MFS transporter